VTLSDSSFDPNNLNPLHLREPPVPRDYHAKVIRELTRAGAKVIALDYRFDQPSVNEDEDRELADAARESGRVMWACAVKPTDPQKCFLPPKKLAL
jgi:CHASE2 domain-containing sensor protein